MIHVILGTGVPSWIGWALTYAAHAVAWLVVGWLCCRPALRLGARVHNLVWRAALVAPLLSASLHAAGLSPAQLRAWEVSLAPPGLAPASPVARGFATRGDRAGLDEPTRVAPPVVAVEKASGRAKAKAATWTSAIPRSSTRGKSSEPSRASAIWTIPAWTGFADATSPPGPSTPARVAVLARGPARPTAGSFLANLPRLPRLPPLSNLVLGLLGAVALVRLARLGVAVFRLRQRLRARRPVRDEGAHELLATLCQRSGLRRAVRLTESAALGSPVALGGGEICLPTRSLGELDDRALAAVLAHELAHLERRDNAWLLLSAIIEAVLWAPPLAWLVRRSMQESAEHACDDRAVELTQDPMGLARSLAEVAAWTLEEAPPALAHAIASPRGLLARVERLLAGDQRPATTPWLGRAVGGALLLLVLLAAPAVGTAVAGAPEVAAVTPVTPAPAVAPVTPVTPLAPLPSITPTPLPPAPLPPARLTNAAPTWPKTVPNDKPGAPRLPARPPAVMPSAPALAPDPFQPFGGFNFSAPRRPRAPRPPRTGFPLPPLPHGAINQIVKQALAESRLAMNLAAARQELEHLRAAGASESERKIAEKRIAEIEHEREAAKRERSQHQDEFTREMDAWGEEMNRRGEQFGRDMEIWATTFGEANEEQKVRSHEEQLKRNEEQLKRNEEQLKRNEERMKRDAEHLRREADRLEREAARIAERAARVRTREGWTAPPPPPAPPAPATRPPAPTPPSPAAKPTPVATPKPAPQH